MSAIEVPQVPFTSTCFKEAGSGCTYVLVQCADHIDQVNYTVYDGCRDASTPGTRRVTGAAQCSPDAALSTTEGDAGRHGPAFSFPVKKGNTYFIVANLTYDEEHGGATCTMHWSVDPNKRRAGAKRSRPTTAVDAASATGDAAIPAATVSKRKRAVAADQGATPAAAVAAK
jgi:hypothetical protein